MSADASLEADDDYIRTVLENGSYMKYGDEGVPVVVADKKKQESSKEDEEEDSEEAIGDSESKREKSGPPLDKDFAKLLNEIEVRFRKDDPESSRNDKHPLKGYSKKLVTLLGRGSLLLGVVCHVLAADNTGEFDPYVIERIKNAV